MNAWQLLTTHRAAETWKTMLSHRRTLFDDTDFFKMPGVWEYLCEESDDWQIKTYRSAETEDFKRKAGVVAFGNRVTLTVDAMLMERARQGCKLSNFILAHELGHLALDHHSNSAVTKNFQLFAGPQGLANIPPTLEELEANIAAVFFQCGTALMDNRWTATELAHRAYSDVYYVGKVQRIVQLDVFQRELNKPRPTIERVVL